MMVKNGVKRNTVKSVAKKTLFLTALVLTVCLFAFVSDDGGVYSEVNADGPALGESDLVFTQIGTSATANVSGIQTLSDPLVGGLIIPETVRIGTTDCNVIGINNNVFQNQTGLTSVVIPDTLTSIGTNAFNGCTGLTSLSMPISLSITNANIFAGCVNISEFTLTPGTGIEAVYTTSTRFYTPWYISNGVAGGTTVILSDDITSLGTNTFNGCTNMISITMPISLSFAGTVFTGCTGVTDVTLTVGNGVARDFTSTSYQYTPWYISRGNTISFTISEDITAIGEYTFYNSTLGSIDLPDGVVSIGGFAFRNCVNLTNIDIPLGVTSINSYTFAGCSGLETIEFSSNILAVKDNAFNGCTGLESIVIPDSVTAIETNAFYGCTGLTSVVISENLSIIGNYAFNGCTNIETLTLPVSLNLTTQAFANSAKINHIIFTKGNGTMVNYASAPNNTPWYVSRNIVGGIAVDLPEGITNIGSFTFAGGIGLHSIAIPYGVTTIGTNAFTGCSNLVVVAMPSSVATIGANAFQNCAALNTLAIPDTTSVSGIGFDNKRVVFFTGADVATASLNINRTVNLILETPEGFLITDLIAGTTKGGNNVPASGIDSNWTLTVGSNITIYVEATSADEYEITLFIIGLGGLEFALDGSSHYDPVTGTSLTVLINSTVSIRAIAGEGYAFIGWNTGTSNTLTLDRTSDGETFTATFVIMEFTVTLDVGPNGYMEYSIDGATPMRYIAPFTIQYGKGLVVTAYADSNYRIAEWTGDGTPVLDTVTISSVTKNIIIGVTFELIDVKITLNVGENGSVRYCVNGGIAQNYVGPLTVQHGQNVQFIASGNDGFEFNSWTSSVGTMDGNVLSIQNVSADTVISVSFAVSEPGDDGDGGSGGVGNIPIIPIMVIVCMMVIIAALFIRLD